MAGYDGSPRYGGDRGTAPGTAAGARIDPHEALYLNVRYVDDTVIDVSDHNTMKVVKALGGLDSFEFDAAAVEWVEHDLYRRSDTIDGGVANNATTITVTGKAHRYPHGTVLMFVDQDGTQETGTGVAGTTEYMRVTAQTDANTLTVQRDYANTLGVESGSWPVWVTGTARFYVAGATYQEGNVWATRDTFIKALRYNLGQITQESVAATWRDQGTTRYGTPGNDFDEQVALALKTKVLALEQNVLLGTRFVGLTAAEPAMMGGVLFFVDSSYDSSVQETDKAGGVIVLKDINDILQNIAEVVGEENCAKTIFTDYWGHRKINSFFEPSVRLAREENTVGLIVQTIDTVVGPVQLIADANMPRGTMLFLNSDQGKVGHHKNGRLRMGDVGYLPGDYDQTWIYGDYSMSFKNPVTCGKIINYSLTA
jgi:hypothetical protein